MADDPLIEPDVPEGTSCRFAERGCTSPARIHVELERGCLCFPEDREQDLCLQHAAKLTAL